MVCWGWKVSWTLRGVSSQCGTELRKVIRQIQIQIDVPMLQAGEEIVELPHIQEHIVEVLVPHAMKDMHHKRICERTGEQINVSFQVDLSGAQSTTHRGGERTLWHHRSRNMLLKCSR